MPGKLTLALDPFNSGKMTTMIPGKIIYKFNNSVLYFPTVCQALLRISGRLNMSSDPYTCGTLSTIIPAVLNSTDVIICCLLQLWEVKILRWLIKEIFALYQLLRWGILFVNIKNNIKNSYHSAVQTLTQSTLLRPRCGFIFRAWILKVLCIVRADFLSHPHKIICMQVTPWFLLSKGVRKLFEDWISLLQNKNDLHKKDWASVQAIKCTLPHTHTYVCKSRARVTSPHIGEKLWGKTVGPKQTWGEHAKPSWYPQAGIEQRTLEQWGKNSTCLSSAAIKSECSKLMFQKTSKFNKIDFSVNFIESYAIWINYIHRMNWINSCIKQLL